jgi:phosphoribosylanthranilate isomerase
MQIQYCSITGADDAVDVEDLSAIAKEYPFVEWAILLLPARAGTPRFPGPDWIRNFSENYEGDHTAMHLCDEGLLGFIDGKKEILDLMSGFRRIQLNLKFGDVEGKYDPARLVERVKHSPQWDFILQYSKDKKGLLPLFQDIPNHAVLFDESAGRGLSPESWDAPLAGHFCGYAGGMNPENVGENLRMIARVAASQVIWIDMETGIRTNDVFDLNKVRGVLKTAAPYALEAPPVRVLPHSRREG